MKKLLLMMMIFIQSSAFADHGYYRNSYPEHLELWLDYAKALTHISFLYCVAALFVIGTVGGIVAFLVWIWGMMR